MSPALIAIAADLGLTIVEKVLTKKLGDKNGQLAADILRSVANRAGVGVEDLDSLAETDPTRVGDAMRVVEHMSPELLALYAADQQYQLAVLQAESGEGLFMRAWRPAGMWMILMLWLWNAIILHVCNAYFRIALPVIPFDQLMALTALYFTLYMGGHTLKDVVKNWAGAGK
jgi:hypothetical protein